MGRKLYFPVTGVPTGTKFRIDQGGTNADNAPEALANLDGVAANKLNQANGLIELNSSNKIDNDRIPPGYSGGYLGPMVEGLTSLVINQQGTYVITDYDQFMTYTLAAIGGVVSRVGNTITYTAPGVAGVSGFTLNGKTYNITIGAGNTVNQPTITSPANGATGQPNNVTFTGSSFAVSSGSDTHQGSDWQIATDSGFSNIVQQVTNSAANKTSWTATFLNNNTTYYARVRYKGNNYNYSAWSPVISLTTSAVASYDVSVAGGTISEGQLVTFNITTSNVADNTTLYWSIDTAPANSTDNNDFISALNGSVVINANAGVVTVTTLADMLLEGTENFIFALRSGSVSGPTLATFNNSLLDTSYTLAGTLSLIAYNKYDSASHVVITPDNGILMAGVCYRFGHYMSNYDESKFTPTLVKLNAQNQLDTTFGPNSDGKLFIPEVTDSNQAFSLIAGLHVMANGTIFVTGCIPGQGISYIVKMNADGSRDANFGTNGYLELGYQQANPGYGATYINDSVVNSNGDVYLAVYVNTNANAGNGRIIKLTVSTETFSAVGNQNASYGQASAEQVCITDSNKLISLSSGMFNISGSYNHMLRNHTDSLTIGSSELETASGSSLAISDVLMKSFKGDGGFVIATKTATGNQTGSHGFSLLAYDDNLTLRTTFGTNGVVNISAQQYEGAVYKIRDLHITPTHIYVIGSYDGTYESYLVMRFTAYGALDTTFANNGMSIVSINNKSDYGRAGAYSSSRANLVVVGDTDILINSPSYTNPHNKSGTIGSLQTEIGVVFIDATGNLD